VPSYKQFASYNQIQSSYQRTREMGINEMLLENRIIFLDMPLDPQLVTKAGTVCSWVIKSMLYLQSIKKDQDIHLYINCPGGSIDDTLAIYDTMQFLSCDVATYCVGSAASGGAVVLAAGAKGKRYALPHAKIMIHQPWGAIGGQASDIQIQAEEVLKDKERLNQLLAKHTGQPAERIAADTERDRYMTADQAKEYGLVDEVLTHEPVQKKK
jgi:ATP-dependent Clp protease protease subunit